MYVFGFLRICLNYKAVPKERLFFYAYAIYISLHLSYENPSAKKKPSHNFVIPSVIPISILQTNKRTKKCKMGTRWIRTLFEGGTFLITIVLDNTVEMEYLNKAVYWMLFYYPILQG